MPLSQREKDIAKEKTQEVKKHEDEMDEFESHFRAFALGGSYIIKTASDIASAVGLIDENSEYDIDLEEEFKMLRERSPMGETSGTAEALRHVAPAAAAALPLEKGYRAAQGLGVAGQIAAESALGGAENLLTDVIMGEVQDSDDRLDINLEKAFQSYATGTLITAPISAGGKIAKRSDEAVGQADGETRAKVDEFDETPMQKAEEDFKYFSDEEVTNITGRDAEQRAVEAEMRREGLEDIEDRSVRTDKETMLDKEIKDIENKFNRLEDDTEGYIIANNKELFSGVDNLDAYKMLRDNTKLRDTLKADIEDELFDRLNKIDYLKRGDDRLIEGAKSDLYDIMPNSQRAEELASIRAAKRQELLDNANKGRRPLVNTETLRKELNDATIEFNAAVKGRDKEAIDFAEARLTKAMRDSRAYSIETNMIDTLDDMYDIGVSPAKSDIRATEAIEIGRGKREYNPEKAQEIIDNAEIDDFYNRFSDMIRAKVDDTQKAKADIDSNRLNSMEGASKNAINKQTKKVFDSRWKQESDSIKHVDIIDKVSSNKYSKIAELSRGLDIDVKVVDDIHTFKDGKSFAGLTDVSNGNKILLKKGFTEDDLFHEITHALTEKGLKVGDTNYNKLKKSMDDLVELNVIRKEDYANSDPYEFLSEMYSNKELLGKINKNRTVFNDIKDTIKNIIRKYIAPDMKVTADEIGREVDRVFDNIVKRNNIKHDSNIRATVFKDMDKFRNILADTLETKGAKNFRKMYNATQQAFNSAERFKTVVIDQVYEATKHMPNKGKDFRRNMTEYLLKTDYQSISEFKTPSEALQFKNKHKEIYRKAGREIMLLARSMSDSKHMNNIHWRGNGYAIAKKVGLDEKLANTIDKLVSIEAMNSKAWKFVETNRDTEAFNLAMDLMKLRDVESNKLFKNNPYNKIKGYTSEILLNMPSEFKWKRGAIPPETQTKIKGQVVEMKGKMTDDELIAYAEANDMGIALDALGNPKLARKVASEEYKVNVLGKELDFGEVIGDTIGASIRKTNINSHVINKINEVLSDKNNGIFNGDSNMFFMLTDDELAMLPKQLRGSIQSIHKDYKQMVIGNMETHLETSKQSYITAQVFAKEMVAGFKENVVLKNPVSYANSFMFNYTIGLQNGISPKRMFKYQQKAFSEYKKIRTLQEGIIKEIIAGRNGSDTYKSLVKEIQSLDLYRLQKEGLAFSVLSDITSAPSYSNKMSDKILKGIMKDVFKMKDESIEKVSNIAGEIYIHPKAKTGKFALDTFTKIDVSGRYGIAMDALEKGKSYSEAANKANGIFGDLDKLSPEWVQAISEFGFIPFGNWFYRIAGGLTTNMYENTAKAISLGIGLYVLENYTGKRTESFNPMLTIMNSPADMLMMSPYLNINSSEEFILPEVYDKLSKGEPDKLIASDSF